MEKYGVSHNTQNKEWKQKWYSNEEWVKNRNEKIFQTMLKNNSFAFSKTEHIILSFLKENFLLVKTVAELLGKHLEN